MNICCVGGKQFGDRTELLMLYDNNCRMGGEKQIGDRIERFWEKERLEFL
jgi:hypothetical protein